MLGNLISTKWYTMFDFTYNDTTYTSVGWGDRMVCVSPSGTFDWMVAFGSNRSDGYYHFHTGCGSSSCTQLIHAPIFPKITSASDGRITCQRLYCAAVMDTNQIAGSRSVEESDDQHDEHRQRFRCDRRHPHPLVTSCNHTGGLDIGYDHRGPVLLSDGDLLITGTTGECGRDAEQDSSRDRA